MKRRTPEEARNRINRLSEALIGVPDEIGEEEAEQALCEVGLETEALQERVYQRLYAEAQQYWMAQKDLPPLLKKALDDLRPLSARPRTEAELARQAKTSVERIIEKAKLLASALMPETPLTFAESYRNKQDLTETDRKSIDAVQEQLKKKIERLKRTDDKGQ
jgi:predicted metalloendopeptidase